MVSEEMYVLGTKKSTIRTIFEFGQKRAAEIGAENVFDFSLGNPNVPAPDFIRDAAVDILMHGDPIEVHGYTIAPGKPAVREVLAADLKHRFGMEVTGKNLFMTAGAAASVTITFKALTEPGDEFVTFAPFFPEYRVFVEACGGKLVVVPAKTDDFQIDLTALERALTPQTKAVIVNSPNNPSGAVYIRSSSSQMSHIARSSMPVPASPAFHSFTIIRLSAIPTASPSPCPGSASAISSCRIQRRTSRASTARSRGQRVFSHTSMRPHSGSSSSHAVPGKPPISAPTQRMLHSSMMA